MAATAMVTEGGAGSSVGVRQHTGAPVNRAFLDHLNELIQARSLVGGKLPQPPTLRGRIGAILVDVTRRMIFWLLPQLDRFHAAAIDAVQQLAATQGALDLRVDELAAAQRAAAASPSPSAGSGEPDRRALGGVERKLLEAQLALRETRDEVRELEYRLTTAEEQLPARFEQFEAKITKRLSETGFGFHDLLSRRAATAPGYPPEMVLRILEDHAVGSREMPVVDVGAGEGELLQALDDIGMTASGVEANPVLAAVGAARGLRIVAADPFLHLAALPAACAGAVTAVRIISDLSLPQVVQLLDESIRILKPGGVAVFATPSGQPPLAFVFGKLAELRGFGQVDVTWIAPGAGSRTDPPAGGDGWQYTVLGRKLAPGSESQSPL